MYRNHNIKNGNIRSLDQWRHHNNDLLQNGNNQRQRGDKLVEDSLRLCKERQEANNLSENDVRQKLEHRVDAIGYWEDELERMLNDVKIEDDKLQLCHNRLCESTEKNLKVLWQLARKCLQLRSARPPCESTDDEVDHLLREEVKLTEQNAKIFDDLVAKLQTQHRLNNAIAHRCKTQELLEPEIAEAMRTCVDLEKKYGQHQKNDLLVQMHPVKINFGQWSPLCEDTIRTGLREIHKSNTLRLGGDDALKASNEALEKLYAQINDAFNSRIKIIKIAKANLLNEYKKVQENIQGLLVTKGDLENIYKISLAPEREAQHALAEKVLVSELNMANDPVHRSLHNEIDEYRHTHRLAGQRLDQCVKQLVTSRAVANRLTEDIRRKEAALLIDEIQCSELLNITKLKKI